MSVKTCETCVQRQLLQWGPSPMKARRQSICEDVTCQSHRSSQGAGKENFFTSDLHIVQLARRKGIPVSSGLAKQALAKVVGKQLFAPAQRSIGQSAVEAPWSRLQADLEDFSTKKEQRFCRAPCRCLHP